MPQSWTQKATWDNGVSSPSQFEYHQTICPRNYSVSLFFSLLLHRKAPDIFLPVTTILSGLLSDSTLYSNILLLLDGLHPCKIISSFLSKRAIATLLDHFKIPVSAMSSFLSCYAPLCTSTTPLLLQFHHHIPKHFYSPIFSKCSQTIIPPNSLSERKTHTALLFDEPRVWYHHADWLIVGWENTIVSQ